MGVAVLVAVAVGVDVLVGVEVAVGVGVAHALEVFEAVAVPPLKVQVTLVVKLTGNEFCPATIESDPK